MAVTTPTPVDPAPSVPDSSIDEPTFDSQFEAFLTWLDEDAQPGFNALAENVFDNATDAEASATLAGEKADEAAGSVTAVGLLVVDAEAAKDGAEDARDAALVAAAAAGAAAGLPTYAGKANNPLWVKGDETGPEWDGIKSVGGVALKGAGDIPLNTTPAVAVAALDIDCSTGVYFTKTIAGNSAFTFSNPPASGIAYAFVLELTHTSGTVSWPAGVRWPENTAPTLTTGRTHKFVFSTDDGATRWLGAVNANYSV